MVRRRLAGVTDPHDIAAIMKRCGPLYLYNGRDLALVCAMGTMFGFVFGLATGMLI